jgi:uracil-DNA glycosylase
MIRILQRPVAPLFPRAGKVKMMLFGEAPGPLGADKSGIPFWGDRAGLPVYRALEEAGLAKVPEEAYQGWSGERFQRLGLEPELLDVALSNAFPSCPTRDGQTFHAPTDAELRNPSNLSRLKQELKMAQERCPSQLRVITLGRRAAWTLKRLEQEPPFELWELPHPSAQGLLQAAPGKGKGLKLADLQRAWEENLRELLSF